MSRVTFIAHNGMQTVCDIEPGQSIMDAAVRNSIDGIIAECGGSCVCGTCHVYLVKGETTELSELEADVLSGVASDIRADSRLGCQVVAQPDQDYEVLLPERQM